MHIYKQIFHIKNLIFNTKKTIILIFILVNGFGLLYYKNLEKVYLADIRITAIPPPEILAVDIFSIYEDAFRNKENFENWVQLQNKNIEEIQISINEILGYQVDEKGLFIYNKLVFRNAKTFQRSIYLTVPAENQENLKDIFLYSLYVADLFNKQEESKRKKFNSQLWLNKLDLILQNLKINYTVDINSTASENERSSEKFLTFLRSLTDQLRDLDAAENITNAGKIEPSEVQSARQVAPQVVVTPPKSIYS